MLRTLRRLWWVWLALALGCTLAALLALLAGRALGGREIVYTVRAGSYATRIEALDVDRLLRVTLAATPDVRYFLLRWSPDGSQLAYLAEDNSQFTLHIADGGSGRSRILPAATSGVVLDWSPDGRYLLTLRPITVALRALAVVDVDSGAGRDLVEGDILGAAWSPDGQWIAYLRQSLGPQGDTVLNMVHVTTGEVRWLGYIGRFGATLRWLPDSTRLYLTTASDSEQNVFVSVADASRTRATDFTAVGCIDWTPEQRWLAVCSYLSGNSELFLLDTATAGRPQRVRQTSIAEGFAELARWSPDSHAVVYSVFAQDRRRSLLYLLPIDPGAPALDSALGTPRLLARVEYRGFLSWRP